MTAPFLFSPDIRYQFLCTLLVFPVGLAEIFFEALLFPADLDHHDRDVQHEDGDRLPRVQEDDDTEIINEDA